ncbi:MAG: hypothetical protein ACHREM_19540 [Polyangiales bacterium]
MLALGACSTAAPAQQGDDASAALDAAALGDVVLDAPCSAPVADRPEGGTCVLGATGSVTDLTGAPLGGLVMTVCGSECFGTKSDATGHFAVGVGMFLATENYAVHADGRPDHAVDYLRLGPDAPSVIEVTMRLPLLPASTVQLPADGAAASSITQGDLTLLVPDGTKFDLDIEDYGTTVGRTLRVAAVSLADAPPYASSAHVAAIYALAPSSAKPSKPLGVRLINSAKLPASAAVELLVLGDDYFSLPPSVGVLSVAAAAHVSTDGATIATDSGEGISELTWLGVRLKGN